MGIFSWGGGCIGEEGFWGVCVVLCWFGEEREKWGRILLCLGLGCRCVIEGKQRVSICQGEWSA